MRSKEINSGKLENLEKSSSLWKLETIEGNFSKEMEALTHIQTEKSQNGRINNVNN